VKVIDVYPDDAPDNVPNPAGVRMGGYQMLVRGEAMRGKFRSSFERPEPFIPNEITKVRFELQDVNHTFLKGHKIMVQVHSTWFPLFDRNPQKFVDIYNATEDDFQKAFHRIYRSSEHASHITVKVLIP
jgi:predicted acyl esterase